MARLLRSTVAAAVCGLLLAGCSAGAESSPSDPRSGGRAGDSSGTSAGPSGASVAPLLTGLDVCRLPTAAMVSRAGGSQGEPTSRRLTTLPGYRGVVDQCGFGVSFDSSSFVVALGLAPATAADVRRTGARPVRGPWAVARAGATAAEERVTFLKGRTLVQVRVPVVTGSGSRLAELTAVAAALAGRVPAEPPASDDQTGAGCAGLDRGRVDRALGSPAAVSRSLRYVDGSLMCSWATGTAGARTVTVSVYTNARMGPFLSPLRASGPSADVRGVPGTAFTTPDAAYLVAGDGQAVAVTGRFGAPAPRGRPLPVTGPLAALLRDAARLLR